MGHLQLLQTACRLLMRSGLGGWGRATLVQLASEVRNGGEEAPLAAFTGEGLPVTPHCLDSQT